MILPKRSLIGVALCFFVPPSQGFAIEPGIHYKLRMERPSGTVRFETWTDFNSVKFVAIQSTDPSIPTDTTVIGHERGEVIDIVSSADKSYSELTAEEYAASSRKQGLTFRDVEVKQTLLRSNSLLNMPCKHYRFTITATMHLGRESERVYIQQDYWVTSSIPNRSPKLNMLITQSTGSPEIDDVLNLKNVTGFPLERETTIWFGGVFSGRSVFQIETLKREQIAASDLEIPKGYKRLPFQKSGP